MWYLLSLPDGHFIFLGESSLNGILRLASISYISAKPASYKVGLLSLKISYIVRTVNMESLEHSELIGDINKNKKKVRRRRCIYQRFNTKFKATGSELYDY